MVLLKFRLTCLTWHQSVSVWIEIVDYYLEQNFTLSRFWPDFWFWQTLSPPLAFSPRSGSTGLWIMDHIYYLYSVETQFFQHDHKYFWKNLYTDHVNNINLSTNSDRSTSSIRETLTRDSPPERLLLSKSSFPLLHRWWLWPSSPLYHHHHHHHHHLGLNHHHHYHHFGLHHIITIFLNTFVVSHHLQLYRQRAIVTVVMLGMFLFLMLLL